MIYIYIEFYGELETSLNNYADQITFIYNQPK